MNPPKLFGKTSPLSGRENLIPGVQSILTAVTLEARNEPSGVPVNENIFA